MFGRADIDVSVAEWLHRGRWGNADVLRLRRPDGDWVLKDFSRRCAPVRGSLGRFFTRRECRAMRRLAGVEGAPQDAFELDRHAFCYRYMEGQSLKAMAPGSVPPAFFPKFEALVRAMHGRDVAHLDLRYRRNILVRHDGAPAVLDFQSSVSLDRVPRALGRILRDVDLYAVYKHWDRHSPDTLDAARRAHLARMDRLRRFWIFQGYVYEPGKFKRWVRFLVFGKRKERNPGK